MEAAAKRKLTQSQLDAIMALPSHEDAAVPTEESTMPVSVYVDPAHYERERAAVFGRMPVPVTVSGLLPNPKMAVAHDAYGIPLLLTRDGSGAVHAFLNVCTHRGSKVIENSEPHHCPRMTCPYHAWTFGLDGKLIGVPRSEVFPTLDKAANGLRRLHSREVGGIIWVGLDPAQEPDFSDASGPLSADLEAFNIPNMHVFGRKRFDLKANWKILIETFLETYHVPPLHKNTVAPHFAEVPTLMTHFGPHSRQTTGRAHFEPGKLDIDVDQLHRHVTHAYHLFPSAVLVTSPYHINFVTMMPRAADRTIVDCYMLTNSPPETEKVRELYEKSFKFNFEDVFGAEDFRAAQLVQEGLSSGAISSVRFGGLEQALMNLHRNIDVALSAR